MANQQKKTSIATPPPLIQSTSGSGQALLKTALSTNTKLISDIIFALRLCLSLCKDQISDIQQIQLDYFRDQEDLGVRRQVS